MLVTALRTKIFVIHTTSFEQTLKLQSRTILTNPEFASHTPQAKSQERHHEPELWILWPIAMSISPCYPNGIPEHL